MARGESQTLLIWTIIFLIFSLIMIIVTFVIRSKYTEAASQLAEATSKNNQLTSENGTLKTEGGKLRELIGHPAADMPMADIETAFTDNMKLYSPALPPEGSSYLSVLKDLSASYTNQIKENERLTGTNSRLQTEIQLNNTKKDELQRDFQAMVDQANADLAKEQENHADQIARMTDENTKLKEYADTAIAAAISKRDEAVVDQRKAEAVRDKVLDINVILTSTVAEIDSPIPTYSDAEILWVSSDSKYVRVNLGSNHGLRPRIPFSVYSADVKEISVNSSKGTIEIIKIIDNTTAEARVTRDILINPIIPGDIIYTPIWKPGQNIHVALSSGLDLDGDSVPDPHKAIMLIKMCGGEVDAYIDDLTGEMRNENGKMVREAFLVGEIGRETRYLITGNPPDTDSSETLFNAYRELENDAKNHGLIIISLKDMLKLMGQHPQSETVGFGPRNRAINTYEMQPDVVNQRMPGKVFDKYENPDAEPPANNKTPISPLFNQRKVTLPSGAVSPLFQPKSATSKDIESN
ncbi:MAG: hypothetical protein FWH27_15480 [Planctomycetaceae bacterium]|nr:hypothetical protein [Planctomycetaceae bacterium]